MKPSEWSATLQIRDANALTAKKKHEIALWLRRMAYHLEHNGERYSDNFTANYE